MGGDTNQSRGKGSANPQSIVVEWRETQIHPVTGWVGIQIHLVKKGSTNPRSIVVGWGETQIYLLAGWVEIQIHLVEKRETQILCSGRVAGRDKTQIHLVAGWVGISIGDFWITSSGSLTSH